MDHAAAENFYELLGRHYCHVAVAFETLKLVAVLLFSFESGFLFGMTGMKDFY